MDPRVEKFLNRTTAECERREALKREGEAKEAKEKREELLVSLGLCEREEAQKIPFGETDWRWDAGKVTYYRYKALELSDEEFEAVRAAQEALKSLETETKKKHASFGLQDLKHPLGGNRVAQAFRIFAWVLFVIGLNFGIVVGALQAERAVLTPAGFDLVSMILTWLVFFVCGMLFYGISEALVLLQKIKVAAEASAQTDA